LPDWHIVEQAERSALLYVAGVQRCFGNMKTEVSGDAYNAQFRRIESFSRSRQGTCDRTCDRGFVRSAVANAGAGSLDPHKVPPGVTDREIQLRRRCVFHGHPSPGKGFLFQVKAVREHALVAKKDCGRPYHEPLPDFAAFTGLPIEPPTWALGTASGEIGWLGLMLMSSFVSAALGSEAVAVSDFFNPKGNTDVADCVDGWLFTSDCLMRLIEAPVVRFAYLEGARLEQNAKS
jgi:hypothetical protein